MRSDSYVQIEVDGGVASIEFYHEKKNSMPAVQLKELTEAVERCAKDRDVRVLILRSEGDGAFCAGASFDELVAISNEQEGLAFFSGFAQVINAMRKCPKFILGRVQGKGRGWRSWTGQCNRLLFCAQLGFREIVGAGRGHWAFCGGACGAAQGRTVGHERIGHRRRLVAFG